MDESVKIASGQVIAVQCKKAWFICYCLVFITAVHWFDRNSSNALLAAPVPPDPSLDVTLTVHGKFVNWETGEQRVATIEPQVLWALANELPTRIVYAERVGIIADVGIVPVKVGRCEECEQGEAIARQVYVEFPQPEKDFVRVYRRLERGESWPNIVTDLPHFPFYGRFKSRHEGELASTGSSQELQTCDFLKLIICQGQSPDATNC